MSQHMKCIFNIFFCVEYFEQKRFVKTNPSSSTIPVVLIFVTKLFHSSSYGPQIVLANYHQIQPKYGE